jgi:hypothetical protein
MGRYLPGAILAFFGVIAYVIGCVLYLAHRRQFPRAGAGKSLPAANDNSGPNAGSKTLLVYAIAMIILGVLAMGAGLFALEVTEMHVLGG